MMPGTEMMGGAAQGGAAPGQPQDFGGVFKSEKQNYELLNYKPHLEDVEDALLLKWKEKAN